MSYSYLTNDDIEYNDAFSHLLYSFVVAKLRNMLDENIFSYQQVTTSRDTKHAHINEKEDLQFHLVFVANNLLSKCLYVMNIVFVKWL